MNRECPTPKPEGCRYEGTSQCFLTIHHLYYPKPNYSEGISKVFRQLPENKVLIPHCVHEDLHYQEEAPVKPSRVEMLRAIAREAVKRDEI